MTKHKQQGPIRQNARKTPVARAVRQYVLSCQSASIVASSMLLASSLAIGQDNSDRVLEEIVVTAQKRTENLQDVPISVTAISAANIEELGITSFDDYIAMLPTVSYKTAGPGTGQLVMRGAADGGNGNASGSQPSVGGCNWLFDWLWFGCFYIIYNNCNGLSVNHRIFCYCNIKYVRFCSL